MLKAILYGALLFCSGVRDQDTTPDMTCTKITSDIQVIKAVQSISGYQRHQARKQLEYLQMKSDVLECEESSRFTPQAHPAVPQVYNHNFTWFNNTEHNQKTYCPQINRFLSESKKSDLSNLEQRLDIDMHIMSNIFKCNKYLQNDKK